MLIRTMPRQRRVRGSVPRVKSDSHEIVSRTWLPILAAVSMCYASGEAHAQTPAPPLQSSATMKIAKSRILVRPKAGVGNAALDKVLTAHGGRRVGHLRAIDVHVVELPSTANEMAVVKALQANPHIKFAEPDAALDPSLYLNDPLFGNQWHLPQIGAPTAWDKRTGTGVVIAILDSGIDASHPDLSAQIVAGRKTFDNNDNTADINGHGTRVAGTAAAAGNNSIGLAGVSFGSKIMPIRVTDPTGLGWYSSMASGIIWAADNGARVANISYLGASASSSVLSAAQYMRSKGGVVVVGSGNTGASESYAPTDYITVAGATDSTNTVTRISSYGAYVDVVAPGESIHTTAPNGSYVSSSGTSISTPVVAAVYALMMSANPTLTAAQLDNILFTTATDIGMAGKDDKAGWGIVNAAAAVTKAMQTSAADSTPPVVAIGSPAAGTTVSGAVSVSVSANDNNGVARTELWVNGTLYATDIATPYVFSVDTTKMNDGPATLLAKAFDAAGNAGTASISVNVANDTVAPIVAFQSPGEGTTVSGTVSIAASATDNQKVAQMRLSIDGKEVAMSYGASLSYAWNTGTVSGKRSNPNGKKTAVTHTLTVAASDAAGNVATKSITVKTQ